MIGNLADVAMNPRVPVSAVSIVAPERQVWHRAETIPLPVLLGLVDASTEATTLSDPKGRYSADDFEAYIRHNIRQGDFATVLGGCTDITQAIAFAINSSGVEVTAKAVEAFLAERPEAASTFITTALPELLLCTHQHQFACGVTETLAGDTGGATSQSYMSEGEVIIDGGQLSRERLFARVCLEDIPRALTGESVRNHLHHEDPAEGRADVPQELTLRDLTTPASMAIWLITHDCTSALIAGMNSGVFDADYLSTSLPALEDSGCSITAKAVQKATEVVHDVASALPSSFQDIAGKEAEPDTDRETSHTLSM